MSEQSSQEPTMEEILASIRRIISEDDTPGGDAAEPAAEAAAEPVTVEDPPVAEIVEPEPTAPEAVAEPEPLPPVVEDDDEPLELTEKVETLGDLDVSAADDEEELVVEPAPPEPAPVAAAPPVAIATLVSDHVADAAASAFGQLSAAIAMPRSEQTLEDVVREMLRPLLQQWLDQNLPDIVRQTVDAEVDRIARGRVR